MLLVVTQIEFALGVLVLGLLAHHNVATGCSIAIESEINILAKSNVAIFEGHLATRFIAPAMGRFGLRNTPCSCSLHASSYSRL